MNPAAPLPRPKLFSFDPPWINFGRVPHIQCISINRQLFDFKPLARWRKSAVQIYWHYSVKSCPDNALQSFMSPSETQFFLLQRNSYVLNGFFKCRQTILNRLLTVHRLSRPGNIDGSGHIGTNANGHCY